MLKAMLNVKENIDVRKFPKLVPYLKNKSVGYQGKKSKILTQEDISKFIEEAADEKKLLKKVMNIHIILYINKANNNDSIQVVLILGISGACRREELVKLTIDDIEDVGSVLIVKISDSKTHSERSLTVSNAKYIEIYRKYTALRPPHASSRRLFLR
jgi:integrase